MNKNFTCRLGVNAKDGLGDFAAAGADESGEAEDLAFAESEADVVEAAGRSKIFDTENFVAERAR